MSEYYIKTVIHQGKSLRRLCYLHLGTLKRLFTCQVRNLNELCYISGEGFEISVLSLSGKLWQELLIHLDLFYPLVYILSSSIDPEISSE